MRNDYTIAIRDNIAESGLAQLSKVGFRQQRHLAKCDGILLRSEPLSIDSIPESCSAIARAGVGVNNVPVDALTDRGVVVFNTPGANANSVKELVIAGLLFSSRPIIPAVKWADSITHVSEFHTYIETHKKQFIGSEIAGKTLGVIGLGAVGAQVSNAAEHLGMRVLGYDPYITVSSAWGLSREVGYIDSLEQIFKLSDYITIHVPLSAKTNGMIDARLLAHAKKGACILNFARGELINTKEMVQALRSGNIRVFVTDFPEPELMKHDSVIVMPHLGASTVEAEQNCARMAAIRLIDFLRDGTIVNSVNFPHCRVERSAAHRITIANRNVPSIVGKITAILAAKKINIQDFTNRHKAHVAYNIIDTDVAISVDAIAKIKSIEDVVAVRVLPHV